MNRRTGFKLVNLQSTPLKGQFLWRSQEPWTYIGSRPDIPDFPETAFLRSEGPVHPWTAASGDTWLQRIRSAEREQPM